LETCPDVTAIQIPSEGGTALDGYDGVVTAGRGNALVPEETSVWELSVEQRPGKADEDYDKRLDAPQGASTDRVAYVQVLLAPWKKHQEWQRDRAAEGRWRTVRAYQVDTVMTWLEQAPATTAWLADHLGKQLSGVTSLGWWWERIWLPSTRPALDRELILAGRADAAESLVRAMSGLAPIVRVGGDLRPDELNAFAAASAVDSEGRLDSGPLGVKVLLVGDAESLRVLCRQPQPMVIILPDAGLARNLPAHSHQLVVPVRRGERVDVEVPPLDSQVVRTVLAGQGIDPERSAGLGALGRRSLSALRRALAIHPETLRPSWAPRTPDLLTRRLLLAGGWSSVRSGDLEAVTGLTGCPASEVEEATARLGATDIPFWGEHASLQYLLAPEDAWQLLGACLTREDLDGFTRVCERVLAFDDPITGLSVEDRLVAWREAAPRYSGWLRECLARTLAILGSEVLGDRDVGGRNGATWALVTVRNILEWATAGPDVTRWASLGDVLGLLAEAAPRQFIEAFERVLEDRPELTDGLFAERPRTAFEFAPSSPHTRVLFALERIAWSAEHLDDVVDVLVRLCEIGAKESDGKQPFSSLVAILSAWGPNTSADASTRARILRRLGRSRQTLGARLALALIPNGFDSHVESTGPRFRDWKQDRSPNTHVDMQVVADAAFEVILDAPVSNVEHWAHVVARAEDFPSDRRRIVAERLQLLAGVLSEQDRHIVYLALRELVAKHREYADADWAMSQEDLEEFEGVRCLLEPRNPLLRHEPLFSESFATLGDLRRRDDFHAYQAEVARRRAAAVQDVLDFGGTEAAGQFAERVGRARLVGDALAECTAAVDADMLAWLEATDPTRLDVAFTYLDLRIRRNGLDLRNTFLRSARTVQGQGRVLLLGGFPRDAWNHLATLPTEAADVYWKYFETRGLENADVAEAVRSLTHAGRPKAALDLVLMNSGLEGMAALAAEAMERLVSKDCEQLRHYHYTQWELQQVIDLLAEHTNEIDSRRIAQIEFAILPILGSTARIPTLQTTLLEDPEQYAWFIKQVYHPDKEEASKPADSDDPADARSQSIVKGAYHVLRTLDAVPGQRVDGTIDAERLHHWVNEVRSSLKNCGRLRAGDSQIGQLLAQAPNADDGGIIPVAIRDLLEEVRSGPMENGLSVGLFNRRGVTSRGLFDGGEQERQLARQYGEAAEACAAWPRTMRVLRGLEESYLRDGNREEAETESLRLGLRM
jgi:hypothetical protein